MTWVGEISPAAGFTYSIDQRVAEKWLFDNGDFCGGGARTDHGARIADDEDRRRRQASAPQRRDRFQSAQTRHLLVDHETIAGLKVAGPQQRHAAAIGAHPEALQFQGEFQRVAHRRIIIDNGDNRACFRHCGLWRHRLCGRPWSGHLQAYCSASRHAALIWLNCHAGRKHGCNVAIGGIFRRDLDHDQGQTAAGGKSGALRAGGFGKRRGRRDMSQLLFPRPARISTVVFRPARLR